MNGRNYNGRIKWGMEEKGGSGREYRKRQLKLRTVCGVV